MKNLIRTIVIVLALAVMPASCVGQAKMFKSVASLPDVTSVYIGPAAMKFANAASVVEGDKMSAEAIKQIKSLEVIDCDNKASIPAAVEEARKIIDGMKLDVILESVDDDDITVIYGRTPEDDSQYIESILIESRSADSFSLVYINGKIDIDKLVAEGNKE